VAAVSTAFILPVHNNSDNNAHNTGGSFEQIFKLYDRDPIEILYIIHYPLRFRDDESFEDSWCDDCLYVDNRDEHEYRIFASDIGTASKAIQPKPSRAGINVRH